MVLGDVNLDGEVNFGDIASFIEALTTGNLQAEADVNQDGNVSFADISAVHRTFERLIIGFLKFEDSPANVTLKTDAGFGHPFEDVSYRTDDYYVNELRAVHSCRPFFRVHQLRASCQPSGL